MKKSLLFSCIVATGVPCMFAFEAPEFVPNGAFGGIAPNGKMAASEVYGAVKIINLETGQVKEFIGETYDQEYSLGLGHIVSNNGIVVGSPTANGTAAYCKDGQWYELAVANPVYVNLATSITPDGSRICGQIGCAPMSIDEDNTMGVPVYWDVKSDGTYGEYHVLPYPEKDFTGRAPQYVTAIDISADGKTITGQFIDCTGFFHLPIVYTQGADGEWSYKMLATSEILPEDLSLPENPGEAPTYPQPQDYMTEEEKAEYDLAYDTWISNGYQGEYPEPTDYLSAEGKEKYDAALATYNALMAEWMPKNEAYYDRLYAIMDASQDFEFNQAYVTPDGKSYICNAIMPGESDPMSWGPAPSTYVPWIINVEDESVKKLTFDNVASLSINSVANNDVFFACNGVGASPMTGYIIKDGVCTDLYDYISAYSPEMKTWAEENLVHELEMYDWETEEFSYVEYKYTGLACASEDLTKMAMWHMPEWDYETEYMAFGYIFDFAKSSGVANVAAKHDAHLGFDAAGNLVHGDNVADIKVYDLSGRCVLTDATKGNTLGKGIYIIKGVTTDGVSVAEKVVK